MRLQELLSFCLRTDIVELPLDDRLDGCCDGVRDRDGRAQHRHEEAQQVVGERHIPPHNGDVEGDAWSE